MVKYTEAKKNHIQHICVYGDPGTGKSTLAAKLAEEGKNLIWISMDNGHRIIDKLSEEAKSRIELVYIYDTAENPNAIATCLKLVTGNKCNVCDLHGRVECAGCKKDLECSWTVVELSSIDSNTVVVWDNGSQLTESCINAIAKREALLSKPPIDSTEVKFGFDEWRVLGTMISKFLSEIEHAPYNTIVISHTCESEMEDGRKKLVPLLGTITASRNNGKYFDALIYCEITNKSHKFGSTSTYSATALAKSRTDVSIEKDKVATLFPFFSGTSVPLKLERDREELNELTKEVEAHKASKIHPVSPPKAITLSPNSSALAALVRLRLPK